MLRGISLIKVIKLRGESIDDKEYYKQAKELKDKIKSVVNAEAINFGIQRIQNIFRDNETRLYHWADNRLVPAENNTSERALRGAPIARKISFVSGSENGTKTREILMTILFNLRMYTKDIRLRLKITLDMYAVNEKVNLFPILFPELKQKKREKTKANAPLIKNPQKNLRITITGIINLLLCIATFTSKLSVTMI